VPKLDFEIFSFWCRISLLEARYMYCPDTKIAQYLIMQSTCRSGFLFVAKANNFWFQQVRDSRHGREKTNLFKQVQIK
jgi:hypothetical protein